MTWPKEYDGTERSFLERYVVSEELISSGAPVSLHWAGDRQSGPLLLKHGSEAQRQHFLPKIIKSECFFSIGMSEPNSGSDLASIRTSATKIDGGWLLNVSKIWTSCAHLVTLRRMSISVAGMLGTGKAPLNEAALIKDAGTNFERMIPEVIRLAGLDKPSQRFIDTLNETILNAPSFTLRGGTREILRGIIARGLGMR